MTMILTLTIEDGETIETAVRRQFPHMFATDAAYSPVAVGTVVHGALTGDRYETGKEPEPGAKSAEISQAELLVLVKRVSDTKGLGLSLIKKLLGMTGASKISQLDDAQKVDFAAMLREALGE
jgi:hypothetical protein